MTIRKSLVATLALLSMWMALPIITNAAEVDISWNGPMVATSGVRLYHSTVDGQWTTTPGIEVVDCTAVAAPAPATNCYDNDNPRYRFTISDTTTRTYFALTAFNSAGESLQSESVFADFVAPGVPAGIQINVVVSVTVSRN